MTEADLMRAIMLEVSRTGARVFRNNTGIGLVGKIIDQRIVSGGREITLLNPRRLDAGLCVGSSDLIGFSNDGRFVALEVKSKIGRLSKEQANFIERVRAAGGIAGECRSVEEALKLF